MLPASTGRRKNRDGIKKDGRSVEIQRLIGRALRQAVDLKALGERSITIDCDVLEADGGTRTAAITGGFVALCLAVNKLLKEGKLRFSPIRHQVAAVSCGVVNQIPMLDLCYIEDSSAEVDMNVVMNEKGEFIELQGTGEGRAFLKEELQTLLTYGEKGIGEAMRLQREAIGGQVCHLPILVAATNNAHKLAELRAMLSQSYQVVSMNEMGFDDDVEETGDSFSANATLKAEALRDFTGYAAIADDSGLTVDALQGAPGIYSARYAGEHGNDAKNNAKLLQQMQGQTNRKAAFVSAIAWARPGKQTEVVIGTCPGKYLRLPTAKVGLAMTRCSCMKTA